MSILYLERNFQQIFNLNFMIYAELSEYVPFLWVRGQDVNNILSHIFVSFVS